MSLKIEKTLAHLAALVGFDTQNPPRRINAESEIFTYLKENLKGFQFELFDAGDGCLSLLAKRGQPELLFNFHIDTVPVAQRWSSDPFKLIRQDDKVIGLGACDIKGASACMLAAVAQTQGDVALLFSSDEEHGSSTAIKYFLNRDHSFKKVIVAEPTMAKAVLAHRGIQSARAIFKGISGHASEKRALSDSAIHKSARWMSNTLDWVAEQNQSFDTLSGLPFNIGKVEGGVKGNMIAADCELALGFRPLPGQSAETILQQLRTIGETGDKQQLSSADFELIGGFFGPTLPAANQDFEQAVSAAKSLADDCSLKLGAAVSFWTEASLFSQAGMTALVFGPGDIAQAHTADEWVSLEQLEIVEQQYIQIINKSEH